MTEEINNQEQNQNQGGENLTPEEQREAVRQQVLNAGDNGQSPSLQAQNEKNLIMSGGVHWQPTDEEFLSMTPEQLKAYAEFSGLKNSQLISLGLKIEALRRKNGKKEESPDTSGMSGSELLRMGLRIERGFQTEQQEAEFLKSELERQRQILSTAGSESAKQIRAGLEAEQKRQGIVDELSKHPNALEKLKRDDIKPFMP